MTQIQPGPDSPSGDGPVTPEVVEMPMMLPEGSADSTDTEQVTRPTKLIRIAAMVRALLDEARRAPLDDAGRRSLKEIHERSVHELQEILSPDLQQELAGVTLPFSGETPSESELRIAQAQLVGWLEGLFHGIQATLFTQQVQAQKQFEDMRNRRSLEVGSGAGERIPGAYL
ncbi:MAG TPA: proteasome activator [Acidimicrobiia bacterium]|nr:proteasome activator [Acidimicrobiia bacterium]